MKWMMMYNIKLISFAILLLSGDAFAGNGSGNEPEGDRVEVMQITTVYDGDTFRAYLLNVKQEQRIRVRGVDTPEIEGKCSGERRGAIKARDFVQAELTSARRIILTNVGEDKYKRVLANVIVDGKDLATTLIERNLGRKWKGRRESWCN